jgi:hypothetical protein
MVLFKAFFFLNYLQKLPPKTVSQLHLYENSQLKIANSQISYVD